MLVLTRKSNQSIMIGDNIEVSVLAIMGEKVRIGIQADRSVPVFRKEVYLEIQAEQPPDGSAPEPQSDGSAPAESPDGSAPEDDGSAPDDSASANGRSEVDAALRSIGESE
jgi:carbon storage regulator